MLVVRQKMISMGSFKRSISGDGSRLLIVHSSVVRSLVVSVELEYLGSLAHGGDLVRNIKNLDHVLIDLIELRFYFLNIGLDLISGGLRSCPTEFRSHPAGYRSLTRSCASLPVLSVVVRCSLALASFQALFSLSS